MKIILAFVVGALLALLLLSTIFIFHEVYDTNHVEHQAIMTRIDQLESNMNFKIDDMHQDIKVLLKIATARNDTNE